MGLTRNERNLKIKAAISQAESAVGRMKTAIGVAKISEAEDAISYMSGALSNLAVHWFPTGSESTAAPADSVPAGTASGDKVEAMEAPPEYVFIEKVDKAEKSAASPASTPTAK